MTDFKGLNDWVEIFKGGKRVDNRGREHDGDEIISNAIKSFDISEHEPPLVVGFPKENSPAYGWVKGLKDAIKGGSRVLLAKFNQVAPELEEAVRQGVYKRLSTNFYPDGRLRRVSLLGPMPPAVKALANIKFKERGDTMTFEFSGSGNSDPGAELERKIQEILSNPPTFNEVGLPIENLTYRDAFNIAMRQNPELTEAYLKTIWP